MRGVIGFSASDSFISKAIRWFRQSHISHTFIIINSTKPIFVLEAGKRQVQITAYKKYYNKDFVELYRPLVDDIQIDRAIDAMIPYLEKSYGYVQLLGFAFVSILKWLGIKIDNPIKNGIICSELVRNYLIALGFGEFRALDKDTAAPDDLLHIIKNSDKFIRIQ